MIVRRVLYKNKWISIRSVEDKERGIPPYYYKHIETSNGTTIAILPYRWVNDEFEFMVLSEMRPAWDTCSLTKKHYSSITGCVENGENSFGGAVREFNEETPYHIESDELRKRLVFLGDSFTTKSSDTVVYMFAIEILPTDIEVGTNGGDGSYMEKTAEPVWLKFKDIEKVKDPLISHLLMKFFIKTNSLTYF